MQELLQAAWEMQQQIWNKPKLSLHSSAFDMEFIDDMMILLQIDTS